MRLNPISRLRACQEGHLTLNERQLKHCLVWDKLFRNESFFDAHISAHGNSNANVMLIGPQLRDIYEGKDLKDEVVNLVLISIDDSETERVKHSFAGIEENIWGCLRLQDYGHTECIATIQDCNWKLNIWQWDTWQGAEIQIVDVMKLLINNQTTFAMYAEDNDNEDTLGWGVHKFSCATPILDCDGFGIEYPSPQGQIREWSFIEKRTERPTSRQYDSLRALKLSAPTSRTYPTLRPRPEPSARQLISHYPTLTSLLSQLSATDASMLLAVIPGSTQQTKYLDFIRDLPDTTWWREKTSQGFEVYLIGADAGLLWRRIHHPLQYWDEHGARVLRVWLVAISPEAERRKQEEREAYVVRKNWEIEWGHANPPITGTRPLCDNYGCSGCPYASSALPLPQVFAATTNCGKDPTWFRYETADRIELTWTAVPSRSVPPSVNVCFRAACHSCERRQYDIGGIHINDDEPSVPYIRLSSGQLAVSYARNSRDRLAALNIFLHCQTRLTPFQRRTMPIKRWEAYWEVTEL